MIAKASFCLVAALLLAGCSPPVRTDDNATPGASPGATPEPTPHPALGATQQAMRLYPDLGKPNSPFNTTFRELYADRKKKDPASLALPDWPLTLARETARMLGVNAAAVASSQPSPAGTPEDWFQKSLQDGATSLDAPPPGSPQSGSAVPHPVQQGGAAALNRPAPRPY